MGVLSWIILGLVAGWLANRLMVGRGQGFLMNTVLGIVGAVLGGAIMTALGREDVSGVNIYSMAVAIVGAVLVLGVARAVRR